MKNKKLFINKKSPLTHLKNLGSRVFSGVENMY